MRELVHRARQAQLLLTILLIGTAVRVLSLELVGILMILVVRAVLERQAWRRPVLAVAAAVGAMAVTRWEVALLAVALLLLGAILRQVPGRLVAGALVAAVLTSGPWLVAVRVVAGVLQQRCHVLPG